VSRLIYALLLIVAVIAPATPVRAEDQAQRIPKESLEKLEDVFADVANNLRMQSDEYFHEGDYERAISAMRLIAEMDPTDDQAYAVASWLLDSEGKEAEGIALLELGLARNKDRYELYAELGQRYFHMERYAEAARYFQSALKFKDCPVMYWHMLAHSYEKSGLLEKCIETWQHAGELEPGSVVVKNNLERVQKKLAEERSRQSK
jgi:tetratricopeptide (TPR) repeat protein